MESAVSDTTTSILWESACFDASSVRLTAQHHGIRTDASTRYEKSLDPLLAGTTFDRVVQYMNFLGKNSNTTGKSSYLNASHVNHISIDVGYDFINMKAGVTIPREEVNAILERLGFQSTIHDSRFTVEVPSWRASKDIKIREDIAEEVVRIYGYDRVPYTALSTDFRIGKKNAEIELRNLSNTHFSERGWNEVYNYSFTNEVLEHKAGYIHLDNMVSIQNAFNEEYTHMVRSLAPRLFQGINHNQKYAEKFGFFEVAKVYHKA